MAQIKELYIEKTTKTVFILYFIEYLRKYFQAKLFHSFCKEKFIFQKLVYH